MMGNTALRRPGRGDRVFIDAGGDGFELRTRGRATTLLTQGAGATLGATPTSPGVFKVPETAAEQLIAAAAELRAVVLPRAGAKLGVAASAPRVVTDLTPYPMWEAHAPQLLGERYELLREGEILAAAGCCDACGRPGSFLDVGYRYDTDTEVATATSLMVLCEPCSLLAHPGYARTTGNTAIAELAAETVNGFDTEQYQQYLHEQRARWFEHNIINWDVNLDLLNA